MIEDKIRKMIDHGVLAVLYFYFSQKYGEGGKIIKNDYDRESEPMTIVCGPRGSEIYFGSDVPPKEKVCPEAEEFLKVEKKTRLERLYD